MIRHLLSTCLLPATFIYADSAVEEKSSDTESNLVNIDQIVCSLSMRTTQEPLKGAQESAAVEEIPQQLLLSQIVLENGQYLEGFDLNQYLNQPLTVKHVEKIQQDIKDYLLTNQYSMLIVQVPEQDISNGTLRVRIQETRAEKIRFYGNNWFSDGFLKARIAVREGAMIDESELLNDIAWLNRNPFHHTEVVLSPGSQNGTSDLEFITKDRFPLRFFAGVDNTGIESTDEIRLYTGANWGNTFWVGDLLTYQFTSAPNINTFSSHFGSYTIFLPWQHSFTTYGGYASIHPNIPGFKSHGTDAQISNRYTIPFSPIYKPFLQEFMFGYDFKQYNNDLFFSEIALPVATQKVAINQFYLGYQRQFKGYPHQTTFKLEIIGSPGKWLPHQTNADYDSLRPGARPRYIYGRMAVGDIYTMPKDFELSWLFRGQLASSPLLPSEQFGLGGYDTIRGYDERDYNADNAICGNLELHTPTWRFIRKAKDSLYFLGFVDYGWGRNNQTTSGIPSTQTLVGTGLGVRYNIGPYLTTRLDYGFQLHHIFDDHRFGKFHFAVIAAY